MRSGASNIWFVRRNQFEIPIVSWREVKGQEIVNARFFPPLFVELRGHLIGGDREEIETKGRKTETENGRVKG